MNASLLRSVGFIENTAVIPHNLCGECILSHILLEGGRKNGLRKNFDRCSAVALKIWQMFRK
jgi:hypothetical protein